MKNVRFHLEPEGNVFAAMEVNTRNGMVEGLGAVYDYANSPVAGTAASLDYLRKCKRISEAKARQVHPALFGVLDRAD